MAETEVVSTEPKKGDQPTEAQAQVIKEIEEWIDTEPIAELIVEELVDQGVEPTTAIVQDIWLGILYNLGFDIDDRVGMYIEKHPELAQELQED
jgi:hypothetical protein